MCVSCGNNVVWQYVPIIEGQQWESTANLEEWLKRGETAIHEEACNGERYGDGVCGVDKQISFRQ